MLTPMTTHSFRGPTVAALPKSDKLRFEEGMPSKWSFVSCCSLCSWQALAGPSGEGVRPGATSRVERLWRVGLALTAIGVIWTLFAWWMVIRELILVVRVVLLLVSRRMGAVT